MSDDTGPATGFETAVEGVLAPQAGAQPEAAVYPDADVAAAAGTAAGERADAGAGGVIHVCAYTPHGQRCLISGLSRGVAVYFDRLGYVRVREATVEDMTWWIWGAREA